MEKEILLTFDMEWASDKVLEYFYNIICELDVCGTLFVTHDTRILEKIRREGRLELGIHPNFNKLLENTDDSDENVQERIRKLMEIVPEAVSVRSHTLLRGSVISKYFASNGLKYESNIFYPPMEGIEIRSFKDLSGMIQIPILFEDDIYLSSDRKYEIAWYFSNAFIAPRLFNFHPLHVFLNTDKMERYDEAKQYINNHSTLQKYINRDQPGVEEYLRKIVSIGKKEGYVFKKMREAKVADIR